MDTTTLSDQATLDRMIRDARHELRVAEMMASRENQTQREYIDAKERLMRAGAQFDATLELVAE